VKVPIVIEVAGKAEALPCSAQNVKQRTSSVDS
jgi:hypothetical protein